ncbi:unnamed protein product, partial [marine sediment metagenome]
MEKIVKFILIVVLIGVAGYFIFIGVTYQFNLDLNNL